MGAHPHAPQGPAPAWPPHRRPPGGGEAAGEVSAAPVVLAPLALDEAGIVPMAGPGGVADGLIVLGVLVGVGNEHGQRRADGLALEYAGEHLHRVALPAGGSGGVLAGLPPVQLPLNGLQIQLQAGGGRPPAPRRWPGRGTRRKSCVACGFPSFAFSGFVPGRPGLRAGVDAPSWRCGDRCGLRR